MYSADSLLEGKNGALETALWSALNVLEENSALSKRLAEEARAGDRVLSAARFEAKAEETTRHATLLREILLSDLNHEAQLLSDEDEVEAEEDGARHRTAGQAAGGAREAEG